MLLAALVLAAAAPAPPERYDYIVKDFVAGALERSEAGGKVEISFSYRDNGRGPTMKESYALDKDGTTSAFR